MELEKKTHQVLRWATRILAAAIIIFGLPFYLGYGNPLPFINPDYSIWDNTWLTVLPLMFIGLGLGWKWPKIGGLLVTVPILLGSIIGLIVGGGMAVHMFVPLIVGTFYMVIGWGSPRGT